MKSEDQRNRRLEDRELNQARSKPDAVDWPVRTAHTFVHHYNSTQYCNTETVLFSIFLFLQDGTCIEWSVRNLATDQSRPHNLVSKKDSLPSVVHATCLVRLLYCAHLPMHRRVHFLHDAALPEPPVMTSPTLEIEQLHDAISSAPLLSNTVAKIRPTVNYSTLSLGT